MHKFEYRIYRDYKAYHILHKDPYFFLMSQNYYIKFFECQQHDILTIVFNITMIERLISRLKIMRVFLNNDSLSLFSLSLSPLISNFFQRNVKKWFTPTSR